MDELERYVRTDESGAMRVGRSRVLLDSVVAAFEQGHSPETICQQYPSLSLEDVYGAITYYLAHVDEVNDYLRAQDTVWEEWREKTEKRGSPVVRKLRAMRHSRATEVS